MSVRDTYSGGVLIERRDDATRTVTTYNAQGGVTGTRAYTTQENALADLVATAEAEMSNEAAIANKIVTVDMPALAALLAATNATINANPATYIKDLAKAVRRLDRKVQRLLDGSD